jgi:hypothetical protein
MHGPGTPVVQTAASQHLQDPPPLHQPTHACIFLQILLLLQILQIPLLLHAQELTLRNNPIAGSIPAKWTLPSGLEMLDLSGCQLTGTIPAGWVLPQSMRRLDLSKNRYVLGPQHPVRSWRVRVCIELHIMQCLQKVHCQSMQLRGSGLKMGNSSIEHRVCSSAAAVQSGK